MRDVLITGNPVRVPAKRRIDVARFAVVQSER